MMSSCSQGMSAPAGIGTLRGIIVGGCVLNPPKELGTFHAQYPI